MCLLIGKERGKKMILNDLVEQVKNVLTAPYTYEETDESIPIEEVTESETPAEEIEPIIPE